MKKAASTRKAPAAPRPNLVRPGVAAAAMSVHERTIDRRIRDGSLKAYRFGRGVVLIDLDEVYALLTPIPAAQPAPEPGTAA